jgi:hypothetical protein
MKPHRRKKNAPRRKKPTGKRPEGQVEAQPETQPQPEITEQAAHVEPGDGVYDPAQALVDSEAGHPDSSQYPTETEQAYVDPAPQAPVDPPGYPSQQPPQQMAPEAGIYDEVQATPNQQQSAPPAGTPKRKITPKSGPPRRRPVAGSRARPAGRYKPPRQTYGGGVSVMTIFLGLIGLAMLVVVVMVLTPKDLSAIQGYPVNPLAAGGQPRNILGEAQKIMIDRSGDLELSEAEVNTYLNHRVQGAQGGMMSAIVKFRGVYVDFSPGMVEIFVEREIFGLPMTMSSRIKTEMFRSQVRYRPAGWTLGKINLGTANIKPVIEMFERLRKTCSEEYMTIRQMVEVRFEENMVILDSTI